MSSSLKRFQKKDFFMQLYFKYSMVVFLLAGCKHAFSTIIRLFSGDAFVINQTGAKKINKENKVLNTTIFKNIAFIHF